MNKKHCLVLLLIGLVAFVITGCGNGNDNNGEIAVAEPETTFPERVYPSEIELEGIVTDIVQYHSFPDVTLSEIEILPNPEIAEPHHLLHITFSYDHELAEDEAKRIMEANSSRILGILSHRGIANVTNATVYWNDENHNRTIEYVFRYRNGRRQNRFSIVEIIEHE